METSPRPLPWVSDGGSELSFAAWAHESGASWRRFTRVDMWSAPSFEERYALPGPWSLVVPFNDETKPIGRSNLLTMDFRSGRYTGRIDHAETAKDSKGKTVLNLAGRDAMSFLGDSDAWPVPSTPAVAGDVTQASAYDVRSGPAETVLHGAIQANAIDRDGRPFVLAPDQGRGVNIEQHLRFGNLLEIVTRNCRAANLGVRLGLVADDPNDTLATLTCSFFVPRDRSADFRISTEAGTLRSWSQASDAPTGTRALVAGGGQLAGRKLRLVIDQGAEATSGRQVEIFVDARDIDPADPNVDALMDARGLQALADAAAQSSATIEATDAVGMRYDGGDLIQVGDLLALAPIPELASVERLEAVVISQQAGSGVQVSLVPGNADGSDPNYRIAKVLRLLRRDINALQRGV